MQSDAAGFHIPERRCFRSYQKGSPVSSVGAGNASSFAYAAVIGPGRSTRPGQSQSFFLA
ncbi:hypothetical protein BKP42_58610 [Rhodococcus erythropolis]|nr:hypothetical protein BKP42_58610 [Rhodococcus erythropolis]